MIFKKDPNAVIEREKEELEKREREERKATFTCSNCYEEGHTSASCLKPKRP